MTLNFCSSNSPHLSELPIYLIPPIELSHGWMKWHLSNKCTPSQSHPSVPSQPTSPTGHKRKVLLLNDSTRHLPSHLSQKYSGHSFLDICVICPHSLSDFPVHCLSALFSRFSPSTTARIKLLQQRLSLSAVLPLAVCFQVANKVTAALF